MSVPVVSPSIEFWGTTIMETHIYIYISSSIVTSADQGGSPDPPNDVHKVGSHITSWNLWF